MSDFKFPEGTHLTLNETNKAELHLPGRSAYQNLPKSVKADIKSSFRWSRYSQAWVSRSKDGRIGWTMSKYNIPYEGAESLRTFEEMEELKADRSRKKADKYAEYSYNAKERAELLQSEFNKLRKDYTWLTQPTTQGSGGKAFKRSVDRVMSKYDKGFEECNKADYYKELAAKADIKAEQKYLTDKGYLQNRVNENLKKIKQFPDFEKKYNAEKENIRGSYLMWYDGRMNDYKLAFQKYEYYRHYLDEIIAKEKESGTYTDIKELKKGLKKRLKNYLKEKYNINLKSLTIAFASKRRTVYYIETDKNLPDYLHSGWGAKNVSQLDILYLDEILRTWENKSDMPELLIISTELFT